MRLSALLSPKIDFLPNKWTASPATAHPAPPPTHSTRHGSSFHTTGCACTSRVCRPREDDARCDSPRLEFDQVVLRFAIASRSRRPRRPRGPRAEERFCGPTTIPYFRLWASRLCVLFVWCPCRRGHSTPGARTPSQRSGRRPTLLDGGFFLREAKIPSHHSAEGRASSAHYKLCVHITCVQAA